MVYIINEDPCKCRVITEYIDDVPYEREILCKACAAFEFGEDEFFGNDE